MTAIPLTTPTVRPGNMRHGRGDAYGHARLPASAHAPAPERVDKIPYGRFRNVYLYITEACQLRCEHCYMGERLERALKMPFDQITQTLTTWRQMGGAKLTILGGEPTLHPHYIDAIRSATEIGYEHVITTSNGLDPAIRSRGRRQRQAPHSTGLQPHHAARTGRTGALDNPDLLELCEHYDILDKIVLHDDPDGWRLRLHVFLPGYFDRPHNHRWTYSSRILHGSYTHTLYGTDDQLNADDIDLAALQPRMVRTESTGDFYTLHHTMIHSVTAQPYTTSLIVRGPAVKDRFLVTDRVTGQAWWQHGAATESPDEAARKRMNVAQANACLRHLTELRVLN